MFSVSQDDKTIARTVAEIFGNKPSVSRYWDNDHKSHVDLLVCQDTPTKNANSYATVTLSNFQIGVIDGIPLGVELVAACEKRFIDMPNIVASCAFNIVNSGYSCKPGAIFPNVIKAYNSQVTMKHILFVTPFLWDRSFTTITLASKKTAWLMLVPISDTELDYAERMSSDKLEDIFQEKQINVFDINRKSVI